MPPYTIKNHKIAEIPFTPARDFGGIIVPELVVLHDTAGRLDAGSSVRWLAGNPAKTSAHFVVERNGDVTQMVPINRRANHAGRSIYHGRDGVNGFSIGIEIVNPGWMEPVGGGQARAWWGEKFSDREYSIRAANTPHHRPGMWMDYTQAQISAVTDLLVSLFAQISTLRDIRAHWYVSPGRKVDVNPLFPLDAVRAQVLGHDDPADQDAQDRSDSVRCGQMVWVDAPGDSLNMRRWPSFNPNIITAIPHGTRVPILREGVFEARRWMLTSYAGREGWVLQSYVSEEPV